MTVMPPPVSNLVNEDFPPTKFEVQLNTGTTHLGDQDSVARLVLSKDGIWKTLQGEGPRLGQLTTFMRLGGCNLACSWCDTSYTWDWRGKNGHKYFPTDEVEKVPFSEVIARIAQTGCRSLTITGGEPMLQWQRLNSMFEILSRWVHIEGVVALPYFDSVNFETNGTIFPEWTPRAGGAWQNLNYVVSPKLANSGNPVTPKQLSTLAKFIQAEDADFKFVCDGLEDLNEISALSVALYDATGVELPDTKIWIMPQGVEPGLVNRRAQALADEVIKRGWNMTTRFHLQLWGNARAR